MAMANTPHRGIRVPESVWRPAMERAHSEGRSLSSVVATFLDEYSQGEPDAYGPGDDCQTCGQPAEECGHIRPEVSDRARDFDTS